jgi:hypothetical protein
MMVQRKNILTPTAMLSLSLVLAACGGGGGQYAGAVGGIDASATSAADGSALSGPPSDALGTPLGAGMDAGANVNPAADGSALPVLPADSVGTPLAAGLVVFAPIDSASGGMVTSEDGRLEVSFAPGALIADTTVTITPITNSAPGGIGPAYRLDSGGVAFTSATITASFGATDLDGTAPAALEFAYQGANRSWTLPPGATLTTTTDAAGTLTGGTLSVPTSHFSDWSLVAGWQLTPLEADVDVQGTLQLVVKNCQPDEYPGTDLVSLVSFCAPLTGMYPVIWSVNGKEGGDSTVGTITGNPVSSTASATAIYAAPTTVPSPATVAVSAAVTPLANAGAHSQKYVLVSHVTVQSQPHASIIARAVGGSASTTVQVDSSNTNHISYSVNLNEELHAKLRGPFPQGNGTWLWTLDSSASLDVVGSSYTEDEHQSMGDIDGTTSCDTQSFSLPSTDHDVQMDYTYVQLLYRSASNDFVLSFAGAKLRDCHVVLIDSASDPASREVALDATEDSFARPIEAAENVHVTFPAPADPNRIQTTATVTEPYGEGTTVSPLSLSIAVDIDLAGTFASAKP